MYFARAFIIIILFFAVNKAPIQAQLIVGEERELQAYNVSAAFFSLLRRYDPSVSIFEIDEFVSRRDSYGDGFVADICDFAKSHGVTLTWKKLKVRVEELPVPSLLVISGNGINETASLWLVEAAGDQKVQIYDFLTNKRRILSINLLRLVWRGETFFVRSDHQYFLAIATTLFFVLIFLTHHYVKRTKSTSTAN